ncbi:heme-dependent catalase [Ophiobolus disseminans]|uniref:Catalase n=1 Tax=Ophiobolus disseminans TaxID=1469910 RepID=A0A6A6ZQ58_9PLEO|nr:heme-dependent catalase [Ophiobolus disseminans]
MVWPPLVLATAAACAQLALSACPYMDHESSNSTTHHPHMRRTEAATTPTTSTNEFLAYLGAGERGPILLEDSIFREKIMHFDHERVPERAVHARGAGAHGVFTSFGDRSNITGASFLNRAGKETPVFARFSTVAGRFYTDEGNFDIVGNNIPVFFIQDAIKFPDLIHAVKPRQDNEIPQAATAHDSAWDFFSQQPSSMHTLFWAMSGHGTVRSYRHMDGWGVHTFRLVTDDGKTKLVKFQFRTLQGLASRLWEEQQATAGKNADADRQDLHVQTKQANAASQFEAQIMDEEDQLRFGFDLLDPTKIVPEDIVPFTPLGKLTLNRNPRNYFAETEQIMYQVGHVVRGMDLTDDPLLQGRLFSYLDTQLNRYNGPNFEQIPINQPRVPVHTNTRDGAAQIYIPLNVAAYSPNTLNAGSPKQANKTWGCGFFTAPNRSTGGRLVRALSPTFANAWSQPRLFFNSLLPAEQQFVVNAMRFETSQLTSEVVKNNVIIQLNRVSHDVAVRVAQALDMTAPPADDTFYHENTTIGVSVFRDKLLKLDGLKVGYLTSTTTLSGTASALKSTLSDVKVKLSVVAERLGDGIDQTYSATFAGQFDAIVVDGDANALFAPAGNQAHADSTMPCYGRNATRVTTLYPTGRPLQILQDGYHWGKAVAVAGSSDVIFGAAGIEAGSPGVYHFDDKSNAGMIAKVIAEGLHGFRFLDRHPLDE